MSVDDIGELKSVTTSAAVRAKDGFVSRAVWVVTHEKFIQSLVTSSMIGAVTSFGEGLSVYVEMLVVSVVGVYVPAKIYLAVGLMALFAFALWADANTEEWRALVEETTGEEAADSDEDLTPD